MSGIKDAIPAIMAAMDGRVQGASADLSRLANEQQQSNDVLSKLSRVEDLLRRIGADGKADANELAALRREVEALARLGVDIDIEAELAQLASGTGTEDTKSQLASIKEALSSAKEGVRGDMSSRDFDLQVVTQALTTAMTLQSNLSKRWSDVADAIVGNMRA